MPDTRPAVFLELLGTMGFERVRPGGPRLDQYRVRPELRGLLEDLAPHARIGVIASDPGIEERALRRVLAEHKLDPLLLPSVVVSQGPFESMLGRALEGADLDASPERAIYVGLDATRRLHAVRRGWRAAPHLGLVRSLLANDSLVFVRLDGAPASWRTAVAGRPVVPLLEARAPDAALYAVAARSAIDGLRGIRDAVTVLPGDPAVATLMIEAGDAASSDPDAFDAFLDLLGKDDRVAIETTDARDLVIAVRGDVRPGELHPPGARHGHTRAGYPDPLLLEPVAATSALAGRALTAGELAVFAELDASLYEQTLAAILAAAPGPSRHVHHDGNAVATSWLSSTLQSLCGDAAEKPFPYGGGTLRNVEAEIPGASAELVIVGAHLDSTATFSPGYRTREAERAAPGADDDASGVAAVLTAAALLRALAAQTPPARTIRFALFNAEETGRHGSAAYADELKANGVPVAAMIQADMIGWRDNSFPERRFEIHGTGEKDYGDLVDPTARLTALVRDAARQVSPALTPQVYPLPGMSSDPATHRSDHASFLRQGWPACLVSEDFFAESGATQASASNPHYHREGDTQGTLDLAYAADVARAVAASAWVLATPSVPPLPAPSTDSSESSRMAIVTGPTTRSQPVSNPGPLPKKYLVEFLAQWIHDEDLRCKVLHREIDALTQYDLNAYQRDALLSLDTAKILERIHLEMKHFLGIDLDLLRSQVGGPLPGDPTPLTGGGGSMSAGASTSGAVGILQPLMFMAEQSFYGQGRVHLRRANPVDWKIAAEKIVTVYGQGFDASPKIRFEAKAGDPPSLETVDAEILGTHCGVDVYQTVTVKVKLGHAGHWHVRGRNDVVGEPWSDEPVLVTITS